MAPTTMLCTVIEITYNAWFGLKQVCVLTDLLTKQASLPNKVASECM